MNETLRGLRLQAGKSVCETAKVATVAPSTYYNYEQGISLLSIEQVQPLAELFDVELAEVIEASINSRNDRLSNRK